MVGILQPAPSQVDKPHLTSFYREAEAHRGDSVTDTYLVCYTGWWWSRDSKSLCVPRFL